MAGYGIKANKTWTGTLSEGESTVTIEFDAVGGLGRPAQLGFIDGNQVVTIAFTDGWGTQGTPFEWDLRVACINIAAFAPARKLILTRVDADVVYTVVAK